MKVIIIPILMILPVNLSYGQVHQIEYINDRELYFLSFWDFYSNNRLSTKANGKGYTGIAGTDGIAGVILNPASLSIDNKYQFYFEYIYKNNLQWLANDIYLKQLHPTFLVGQGFSLNDYLQTGIVYCTNNSFKIDFGRVTLCDESANIVGFFHCYTNLKISSFLIPIMFNYKDIIRFGINLIYSNYILKEVLLKDSPNEVTGKINFNKFIPKFGVVIFPLKNLSIGLTFLPKTKETITKKWTSGREYRFQPNVFPSRIGIGIQYDLDAPPMSFSFDYNYSNDSKEKRLVDRKDFHFGLEYNIMANLVLRAGLFSQRDYRNKDIEWLHKVGDYNQIFTTLGVSYKRGFVTLNLSVMDSHLFSKGKIKQTYINTGVSRDL